MKRFFFILLLAAAVSQMGMAQLHYKYAIGIEAGSLNGVSLRVFPSATHPQRAFQFDLGYKLQKTVSGIYFHEDEYPGWGGTIMRLPVRTLEASFYWSHEFTAAEFAAGQIDWYLGGGFHAGTEFHKDVKAGGGMQVGGEFIFANFPLNLGLEFRPGAAAQMIFANDNSGFMLLPMFDWSLGLTARFRLGETTGSRNENPRQKAEKSASVAPSSSSAGSSSFGGSEEKPTEQKKEDKKPDSNGSSYSF